jgi:hypothetical protein
MKWKEIKPDASGVVALFVGGAAILLLTYLAMPSHQFRLGRGGPDVSRDAHPVLYWSCEIAAFLLGGLCIGLGIQLLRGLIRRQRERERSLEQEAMDSFIREHQGAREGPVNDKDQSN